MNGRHHSGELKTEERTILRWIFGEQDLKLMGVMKWPSRESSGALL
jgi:hypothetical protein